MKKIPFFNYPHIFKENEAEYSRALVETCSRGAYIMQQDLRDFEENIKRMLGVKYAIGTADGTMAILAGLVAAGVGPGDEVILPSHTFVATAAAVKHSGATPVLADCKADHTIDAESVKRLLTSKTKCILPVQLNGRTTDMDAICAVAEEHGLVIVEDSCQALGSKFKGVFAGTFGMAGAFSFYPSKTLGCFGDGGAVITNDDKVADYIYKFRDHGRGADGDVTLFGFNARLDNVQAAVLNVKLKYYQAAVEKRRSLAARYEERLKDQKNVLRPPGPDSDSRHYDIFQNYEVEANDRDKLREYLSARGVSTIIQWGGKLIHQFRELRLRHDSRYAEEMSRKYLLLPMNTSLSLDDIDYIADVINDFYK